MPTQITNTASLTFQYGENSGTTISNTATTILKEPITVSKTSLGDTYNVNEYIFYIITIKNNSVSAVKNVKVNDNLGIFSLESSNNTQVIPLTFEGPAKLYIGGEFSSDINPKIFGSKMTFYINSIPSESTAIIIYRALVNSFASLEVGSTINNCTSISARNVSETPEVCNTITVRELADVKIIKTMSPNAILPGNKLTYIFSLYNYGNTEAKNVTLTDKFNPSPTCITVTVDEQTLSLGEYSYLGSILNIPALGSGYSISIPTATFKRDLTGKILTEPGIVTVTVSGKI